MTPDTPLLAGGQGAHRFLAERLHRQRRERARARRRPRLRRRLERRPERRRLQRFSGRGIASAEGLRQATELGTVARIASALSGQAAYRATLAFVAGRPQISVASNLVGVGIDLPPPLGKAAGDAAAAARAHRARRRRGDVGRRAAAREALQVDLGGVLQAHFVREASGDTSRVVRGAVRVGEARPVSGDRALEPTPLDPMEVLPLPASGVAASVNVKQLDVEAWQAALARMQGPLPRAAGTSAAAAAPLVFDSAGGAGYVPDAIALRAGELDLRLASPRQRHRRAVAAGRPLARQRQRRPARRLSRIPAGAARRRPAPAGCLARLSRLSLPKGEAERVETLLDEQPLEHPGARHRRRRLRAARQAPRPARDRGHQPRVGGREGAARVAAREAQPDACPKRSSARPAPGATRRRHPAPGRAGRR